MLFGLIGILVLLCLGKILRLSWAILKKLLVNGLLGWLLLLVLNFFGGFIGITLPVTKLSALIAGFFGLPGVAIMLIFRYLL